jgi:hypothetical protein
MTHSPGAIRTRELIVFACITGLFLFWVVPITALASLLSYKEIQKVWPALARLIAANARVQAIVQNSLPSVAMISLNATLPFWLEGLAASMSYMVSWTHACLLSSHVCARLSFTQFDRIFSYEKVC